MIKTLVSVVLLSLSLVVINADGDESKNEEITTASIEGFVEAVKLAIENNHLNLVQILLDGTDVERDKNFALNYAVRKGTKEMVIEILKDPQVDLGFKTDNMTAIQFSVENDLLDMIPLLLPKTNQFYKSKALGLAVKYNKEEIAKEILKDPEVDGEYKACDRNGCETALEWAVSNNNLNLVQLLLSKTKVEYKTRALDKAKKGSKADIVREISRDPALSKSNALLEAAKNGNEDKVKQLLNDPEVDSDWIPWQAAIIENKHLNLVQLAINKTERKADMSNYLQFAVRNGLEEIAREILKDPDVNLYAWVDYDPDYQFCSRNDCKTSYRQWQLLWRLAIENNHPNLVQLLLNKTERDDRKSWALNYAVWKGAEEMAKEILKDPEIDLQRFEPDSDTPNTGGPTLKIAVDNNLLNVIPLLLPKTEKSHKSLALCVAVKDNKGEISREILKDPEVDGNYNDDGLFCNRVALDWAVSNDNLNLAKLLLSKTKVEYKNETLNKVEQDGKKNIAKEISRDPALSKSLALLEAAKNGNEEKVRQLLKDSDIDYDWVTWQSVVIENNQLNMVQLALNKTEKQSDKNSYLNYAVKNGMEEMATEILKDPEVDVNSRSYVTGVGRRVALEVAVLKNNLNLVQLLVAKTKVEYKSRALDKAKEDGKEDIIKEISKDPALLKSNALLEAATNGNEEKVRQLLSDPDVDSDWIPWQSAILENNQLDLVQLLLNNTEDKSDYLLYAVKNGTDEMVKEILKHSEVNVNQKFRFEFNGIPTYESPLAWAVKADNLNMVQLLTNTTEAEAKSRALNFAAMMGNEKIAETILEDPEVDVNFIWDTCGEYESCWYYGGHDHDSKTALEWCVQNDLLDVIPILLPQTERLYKSRALKDALKDNKEEIAREILKYPDVDVDGDGLEWAVSNDNLNLVQLSLVKTNVASKSRALDKAEKDGKEDIVKEISNDPAFSKSEALLEAVKNGTIEKVRQLLDDPDVDSEWKSKALAEAAKNGDRENVIVLLKDPQIDYNYEIGTCPKDWYLDDNYCKNNALGWAVQNNHTNLVPLLLAKTENRDKSLHTAASYGNEDLVKEILKYPGVDVNEKLADPWGYINTPLEIAVKHDNLNLTQLLLNKTNYYSKSRALSYASKYNHQDVINEILKEPNVDGDISISDWDEGLEKTPIEWAVENSELNLVKLFLPITDKSYKTTALITAVREGKEEIVKEILKDPEVDVNHEGLTSYQMRHLEKPYMSALEWTVKNNDLDMLLLLLAKPEKNPKSTKFTEEALRLAAEEGKEDFVQVIIKDPEIDTGHAMPYSIDEAMEKINIFRLLLPQAKSRGSENDIKSALLIKASRSGEEEIVRILLSDPSININYSDYGGETALIKATKEGEGSVVRMLLDQKGIDVDAIDDDGKSALDYALDYAKRYGNQRREEIVKLFQQKGYKAAGNYLNMMRTDFLEIASSDSPPCPQTTYLPMLFIIPTSIMLL